MSRTSRTLVKRDSIYYRLTRHVVERFAERKSSDFKHLLDHRNENQGGICDRCVDLIYKLTQYVNQNKKFLEEEIQDLLKDSTNEKRIINDSTFMSYYYSKYGYDKAPIFLLSKSGILFICHQERGDGKSIWYCVVTCMPAKWHKATDSVVRKFKKPKLVNSGEQDAR